MNSNCVFIYQNRASRMKGIFFANSDFKNGCKYEFQDINEKLCSWFKNRVPSKIDLRAVGTDESHPTACKLITKNGAS